MQAQQVLSIAKNLGNIVFDYSEGDLFIHHILPFVSFNQVRNELYLVSKKVATLVQHYNGHFLLSLPPEMIRNFDINPGNSFPSLCLFANGISVHLCNNPELMEKNILLAFEIYRKASVMGKKLYINFKTLHRYKEYMTLFETFQIDVVRAEFNEGDMVLLRSMLITIKNFEKKIEQLSLKQKKVFGKNAFTQLISILEFLKEVNVFDYFVKTVVKLEDIAVINLSLNVDYCSMLSHLHESIELPYLKIIFDDFSEDLTFKIKLNTKRVVIESESTKKEFLPKNFPQFNGQVEFLQLKNVRQVYSLKRCSTLGLHPNLVHLNQLDFKQCKLEFLKDDLIFEMPKLSTLAINQCDIKVKRKRDDCTRLLKMFKTPTLSKLTIDGMGLQNIPRVDSQFLTIMELDNNNIACDLVDFERLQKHKLELLSLSYNRISSFKTYERLTKISKKVIILGNVFNAILVKDEIQEFNEEYQVERSKYFNRNIGYLSNDQNILKFMKTQIGKMKTEIRFKLSNLFSKRNLYSTDPNVLFWNLLYSKPFYNNNFTPLTGFLQVGIKLNNHFKELMGKEWLFLGVYIATSRSIRCELLDEEQFKPNMRYIVENWSTLSNQHLDQVFILRQETRKE